MTLKSIAMPGGAGARADGGAPAGRERRLAEETAFTSSDYIDDRPEEGVFTVAPAVYVSPRFFDLEVKYIFERTWNYLGLESQIRQPHDFFTTRIAHTPILVTRTEAGDVRAFLNVCRHKGAVVCRSKEGNAPVHSCQYHNWAYDSTGRNVNIKDRQQGAYPRSFEEQNHDLIPLARTESYCGMIFGSLSPDVPSLNDFLGDMKPFLDIIMKNGANGMEYIPGRAYYTYAGNWKLQADNGLDGYHVTSAHASLLKVAERRRRLEQKTRTIRAANWNSFAAPGLNYFNFPYGHAAIMVDPKESEEQAQSSSPLYRQREEFIARFGEKQARVMMHGVLLHVFPNLQLSNINSVILRQFHPLAVDLTEVQVRALGAIGESREMRALRLRLFEDFHNASGMATPDDSMLYEDCHAALGACRMPHLQGYTRGMAVMETGGNAKSRELGIKPVQSAADVATGAMFPDIGMHSVYREWGRLIDGGLEGRPAYE